MKKGFTLIELLIFIAIFTLIIGSFITILVSVINIQTRQVGMSEVEQQGQFLTQQIQYYVQSARLVDMPLDTVGTSMTLHESTSSIDPTVMTLSSGTMYLAQGIGGSPQPLTDSRVTVSNVSFTRHYNLNSSSSAFGTDSVTYSFTLTAGSLANQASEVFQSSVAVLAPVPKIALIQQARGENNTISNVSSTVVAYPRANEAGDLLIAVVAYKHVGTSSIADTLGNSWSLLMSTTSGALSESFNLYAALSAKAGVNTVTVTFSPDKNFTSAFLYEYRGASTSSSFDASAMQLLADTSTPSSGLVYPTSTVELLMGIDYNANTTEVPTPAVGYTLETSSTANNTTQVFVEDQDQYISGGVSAGWNYTGAPTSTAMIATFK